MKNRCILVSILHRPKIKIRGRKSWKIDKGRIKNAKKRINNKIKVDFMYWKRYSTIIVN
jgi:hypothetical protein